jgi:glycine cleavage system H lipoate-binding protein
MYRSLYQYNKKAKVLWHTYCKTENITIKKTEIMVVFILLAFILLCISVDALVQYSRHKKSKAINLSSVTTRIFNESSVVVPKGLYYDKSHTWAFMEKSGYVKIGIDDFLLHITGNLNRLKMKDEGEKVSKGEAVLSLIQNGKQLTIKSPISGIIKSFNKQIIDNPSIINVSGFNEGWIYTVEPTNWSRDLQFLLMSDKYKEWLKNEFTRLKDFISTITLSNNKELATIILQDGGEIKENLLADYGPEVWEDFQTKFINTAN